MKDIDPNRLGLIRIVRAPEMVPSTDVVEVMLEEVIDKLVGSEFPCLYFNEEGEDVDPESEPEEGPLYVVLQETVLEVISEADPDAAMIWFNCGFPEAEGAIFCFHATVVEVLKPVMSRAEFIKEYAREEYIRGLNS